MSIDNRLTLNILSEPGGSRVVFELLAFTSIDFGFNITVSCYSMARRSSNIFMVGTSETAMLLSTDRIIKVNTISIGSALL
jgi:hypothetical protein